MLEGIRSCLRGLTRNVRFIIVHNTISNFCYITTNLWQYLQQSASCLGVHGALIVRNCVSTIRAKEARDKTRTCVLMLPRLTTVGDLHDTLLPAAATRCILVALALRNHCRQRH
jgi:hypothetical protein